jgi:hypothetical protein
MKILIQRLQKVKAPLKLQHLNTIHPSLHIIVPEAMLPKERLRKKSWDSLIEQVVTLALKPGNDDHLCTLERWKMFMA